MAEKVSIDFQWERPHNNSPTYRRTEKPPSWTHVRSYSKFLSHYFTEYYCEEHNFSRLHLASNKVYFGFQFNGEHFLDFSNIKLDVDELPEDLFQPYSVKTHRLCSCIQSLLKVPRTHHKTFRDRAFAHSGPSLWNKLPFNIPSSPNITIFKSKLKTYFFQKANDLF